MSISKLCFRAIRKNKHVFCPNRAKWLNRVSSHLGPYRGVAQGGFGVLPGARPITAPGITMYKGQKEKDQ